MISNEKTLVWGNISSSGELNSGQGVKAVVKNSEGSYTVVFAENFSSLPAVNATVVRNRESGFDTRDNAMVNTISVSQFTVITGDHSGDPNDRDFTFVAVGA
ncbi:hypothetical protein [Haliangium sp.]|uniref:hypothetical protein n=1 Tax=Haliangium sp. TaxID=2663208 RepID=UPI003D13D2A0